MGELMLKGFLSATLVIGSIFFSYNMISQFKYSSQISKKIEETKSAITVPCKLSNISILKYYNHLSGSTNSSVAPWVTLKSRAYYYLYAEGEWSHDGKAFKDNVLVKRFPSLHHTIEWLRNINSDVNFNIAFTHDNFLLDNEEYYFVQSLQKGNQKTIAYEIPINSKNPEEHFYKRHVWPKSSSLPIVFGIISLFLVVGSILMLKLGFKLNPLISIIGILLLTLGSYFLFGIKKVRDYDKAYKIGKTTVIDMNKIEDESYLKKYVIKQNISSLGEYSLNSYNERIKQIDEYLTKKK